MRFRWVTPRAPDALPTIISRHRLEQLAELVDVEPKPLQDCAQGARWDVMALVHCHDCDARGIVAMGHHDMAASTMDLDEAGASQRPNEPPASYLGQFTHAALDAIRSVWKLARGLGIGRLSFFSPSK